ncbi:MAG TPA: helix-turn-helix domain-containing protein [Mycobacteriales bacterium]|nr:helix-turn-helix domain-containing protein [Mycobacteriales bacterium]
MRSRIGRRSSREALLAAALDEFRDNGYEAATVSGIAQRAGVTTGALYAHFRGKLDLLLQALGIVPAEALLDDLAQLAAQPQPRVAHLLGENMAATPTEATLLLLDAIVAARRDERVARILRDGIGAYEQAIARATEAGQALGVVDPALPARDLVRVLMQLALGRLALAALDAGAPSAAAFERLATLLLQSSGASAGTGPGAALGTVLDTVATQARNLELARQGLADSVVAAVEDGHSLRQVAAAAGVSHERVRQMLREHLRQST